MLVLYSVVCVFSVVRLFASIGLVCFLFLFVGCWLSVVGCFCSFCSSLVCAFICVLDVGCLLLGDG